MTIHEHYENFMSQPNIEGYVELYCSILENRTIDWQKLYYALLNEIGQDRGPFVTPEEQLKEYGQIRDLIEKETTAYGKKCLITVLFDALMVEKIKSYSLNFDVPLILKEELQKVYLEENNFD